MKNVSLIFGLVLFLLASCSDPVMEEIKPVDPAPVAVQKYPWLSGEWTLYSAGYGYSVSPTTFYGLEYFYNVTSNQFCNDTTLVKVKDITPNNLKITKHSDNVFKADQTFFCDVVAKNQYWVVNDYGIDTYKVEDNGDGFVFKYDLSLRQIVVTRFIGNVTYTIKYNKKGS